MYTITGDDLKEEDESFSLSVTAINDVDIIDGDATIFITIEDDGDGMYMCGIDLLHTIKNVTVCACIIIKMRIPG